MEDRAGGCSAQSIRVDPVIAHTFDWNAELETAKRRVAELEGMVSRLRDAVEQMAAAPTPIDKILDRDNRTLSVRMASLERARFHQRFIEHKIQSGTRTVASLPYIDLAHVCFSAAQWMPKGEAAESVRSHAAAFYTKGVAARKVSPSEAEAKAVFQNMAAGWMLPETPE
jgi:hypothetical protein